MGRYTSAVCRLCRREKEKLFLKGSRCMTEKCALKSKDYPPGRRVRFVRKLSGYGVRLREKQKARRIYGLMEKQFRLYFKKAERVKGVTGTKLLELLERRLDNVVFRMGFATSRAQARQLVRHGHFLVNGKKVDIPSYSVEVGDEIQPREKSRGLAIIKEGLEAGAKREKPAWIEIDEGGLKGKVLRFPARDEMPPIQEQLIVELYSK
jgi:small subunit ribosomal protein S4